MKELKRRTPSLTELLDLKPPSYNASKVAQVMMIFHPAANVLMIQADGASPADVSERTDSGLGLNFENLEMSLSRETLQLSRLG